MNARKTFTAALATLMLAALGAQPALANRIPDNIITGTLTSVSGISAVTVNGTMYRVKPGVNLSSSLSQLTPGQTVDLLLDGPATSSASSVIAIRPASSTGN